MRQGNRTSARRTRGNGSAEQNAGFVWSSTTRGQLTAKFSGPERAEDDAPECENMAPLGVRCNVLLGGEAFGRFGT